MSHMDHNDINWYCHHLLLLYWTSFFVFETLISLSKALTKASMGNSKQGAIPSNPQLKFMSYILVRFGPL